MTVSPSHKIDRSQPERPTLHRSLSHLRLPNVRLSDAPLFHKPAPHEQDGYYRDSPLLIGVSFWPRFRSARAVSSRGALKFGFGILLIGRFRLTDFFLPRSGPALHPSLQTLSAFKQGQGSF